MIKLENISKTYISETKQEVNALNGVSFELGSRGLVFILGKSGSGKSTLLNLLGGLDSPSEGEIIVDGVSMKNFTSEDYDAYRNGYVGFIFQEYNLLEDFNVKDNIALALQLSKGDNIDQKVIDALKQVELDEEYLTRRVNEMSGGEKQRVAIARAIVKDSKVILADEPTGNLDSMTGESIWDILKSLSQEKPVVVVSHDRDSAEKYADRIIEIADGEIVSDVGNQPTASDNDAQFTPNKKGLSFNVCLKLAFNSIKQRKIRSASVAITSILCILALLVVQLCLTFSAERAMARIINSNDVPYFTVAQGSQADSVNIKGIGDLEDFFFRLQDSGKLEPDTLQFIDSNANYIIDDIVESKQQVLDFGLTFVGDALELDERSFYVTKQSLEQRLYWGSRIDYRTRDDDGKLIYDYIVEEQDIDILLGKEVRLNILTWWNYTQEYAILAGIIDTDNVSPASREYIPDMLARSDFQYWGTKHELRIGKGSKTVFGDEDTFIKTGFDVDAARDMRSKTVLMLNTDSASEEVYITSGSELSLADDEIVLSAGLVLIVLEGSGRDISDYVDEKTGTIKEIPDILGKTIPIRIYNYKTNELETDLGEFRVVGVSMSSYSFSVIVSDAKLTEIYLQFSEKIPILVQTSSVQNVRKFLTTLRNDYDGYVSKAGMLDAKRYANSDELYPTEIAGSIYRFEKSLVLITIFVGGIGLLMLVVLILLVINLISFSIVDRRKEIGVLTALGTSNRDITKIFLLETLIISVVTLVISLVGAAVTAYFLSRIYFSSFVAHIPLLRVDVLTILMALITSVGFLALAALIPLRKIGKLNPVDAIRDN